MQRAGHVGRRDDDGEHGPWRFGIGTKQLLLHPGAGPALLDLLRFVRFGDLSWHIVSDSLPTREGSSASQPALGSVYPSPLRRAWVTIGARSPALRPLTSRSHENPIIRADCAGRQMRTERGPHQCLHVGLAGRFLKGGSGVTLLHIA